MKLRVFSDERRKTFNELDAELDVLGKQTAKCVSTEELAIKKKMSWIEFYASLDRCYSSNVEFYIILHLYAIYVGVKSAWNCEQFDTNFYF